ncbi:NAD(P) transhydrogenase subunit alpha [Naumannella cuiyingiana]|uniref:proton-translocating NAD(P)(+) transhydrogenase n=1 Tax=Naumannella cuiyingiana TaxID=1347891 RepID=A0A7Z0D674_9ACTN|nr:NAD(P) transhydrogenase subunit alpha [Naumannella cuiyingiana]
MLIGVPAESRTPLVAATPASVTALRRLGHDVLIAAGAGERAGFTDADYAEAGARVVDDGGAWRTDLVLKVDPPNAAELGRLAPGTRLAAQLAPGRSPALLEELAARDLTALALDAVPRISRAQSLDVLSSMANLAGYRAVVEAASAYGGMLGGQVTAAGKVPPARVFVVGAGVAGLAAIGTAQSLGAQVRAFDVRPEVAEQVASMGATNVSLDIATGSDRSDGYAGELTGAAEAAAAEMYAREAAAADIVITTALIPGRPAPRLIDAETVARMRPGSVVVDLAAANGGNVAGTVAGEQVITDNGVTILGWTDLPARLPRQASTLYATNLVNLIKLLTPDRDGRLVVDETDDVQRGMLVADKGAVTWPPPPIAVSAAPAPAPVTAEPAAPRPRGPSRAITLGLVAILGIVAAIQLEWVLGDNLVIFALAVLLGYYVISRVTHALHTPLMSITNAVSGMILVGAMLEVGDSDPLVAGLSMVGIFLASINVFGGFFVTRRMLAMFRRSE